MATVAVFPALKGITTQPHQGWKPCNISGLNVAVFSALKGITTKFCSIQKFFAIVAVFPVLKGITTDYLDKTQWISH